MSDPGEHRADWPRISALTRRILRAIADDTQQPVFGLKIAHRIGRAPGVVYARLKILEEQGWVTGEREDLDPCLLGRPCRKYYRLTDQGVAVLKDAEHE